MHCSSYNSQLQKQSSLYFSLYYSRYCDLWWRTIKICLETTLRVFVMLSLFCCKNVTLRNLRFWTFIMSSRNFHYGFDSETRRDLSVLHWFGCLWFFGSLFDHAFMWKWNVTELAMHRLEAEVKNNWAVVQFGLVSLGSVNCSLV